jgi:hypothetical protein
LRELKIDSELKDLLPPLTDEEYKQLEKNITANGFDKNFPIMEWHGFIADGHNRYAICKKHNIEPVIGTLAYETKEEVMKWMLDIQLGRRNLSPIQRIAIAEKSRPLYEKEAKKRQATSTGGVNPQLVTNSSQADTNKKNRNPTVRKMLSDVAGVGEDTYTKGAKILNSDNEEVKEKVLSGEMSINAGYKEITGKKKDVERENNNATIAAPTIITEVKSTKKETSKPQISDETKQICQDLKTEKTKEYLDSIWDYKVSIIECMNIGFQRYYDGFVSILQEMNGKVDQEELDECIENAERNVEEMLIAIEEAKKIKLKTED